MCQRFDALQFTYSCKLQSYASIYYGLIFVVWICIVFSDVYIIIYSFTTFELVRVTDFVCFNWFRPDKTEMREICGEHQIGIGPAFPDRPPFWEFATYSDSDCRHDAMEPKMSPPAWPFPSFWGQNMKKRENWEFSIPSDQQLIVVCHSLFLLTLYSVWE